MNGAKAPETPSPILQEKTVTPETLPVVIGADEGYTGLSQVTVNPDTNLKAENIRSGKTIFGVDGTFVGEPVYTDGLDINKVTGYFNLDIDGWVARAKCAWNKSPTRLTELDYTTSEHVYPANYTVTGYGETGAIGAGKAGLASSSYLPSVGSYYYYKESGTFSGATEFFLNGDMTHELHWYNASVYPTHVKGTFYVWGDFAYTTSNFNEQPYESDIKFETTNNYGGQIYEVEVDSDIRYEKVDAQYKGVFIMNLPEIAGEVSGNSYSAVKATTMTIRSVPKKVVFS